MFGALAGCVSQEQIPPAAEPAEGLHRLVVAGWDEGPEFAHILAPDEVFDSAQPLSLHAFDVSFDPSAVDLCDQSVALSGTDGPTLPVEAAQRLRINEQGELTWESVSVDPTTGPTFPILDFDFCSSIPGCVEEGECVARCVPSEIVAPEAPRGGCPTNWRDLGDSEMEFCFPDLWSVDGEATAVAPQACPGTEHDLDGTCVPLGPCAPGPFAEPPADAGVVVYVAPSAGMTGDGSATRPYRIEQALDSASSADVVMLAAGRYTLPPNFELGRRRLVGVCADQVFVEAEGLTVTESVSLTGIRVIGRSLAVSVRGGHLALTGVSIESPGQAVAVSDNGTLTSTQSRLQRVVSPNSPDSPALSVLSSTASLHSTSIEGIVSAVDASVSLSHFSVVSTDTFNASFQGDRSTITFTHGRLMNRASQYALFLEDTKQLRATDLLASSLATGTVHVGGTGSDHHFVRLAIASRDSTGAAFRVVQARVQLTDYALFGGGSAMEIRKAEGGEPRMARAVVKRAWLNIGGRVGFWGTTSGGGFDVEDLWFDALPAQSAAVDEFAACLLQRSGQGSVRRARIRAQGRHGLVVTDRGRLMADDVEILGDHGRTMWIVPGSEMPVRRLRATGSAGLDGSDFGTPGQRSRMSDIDLQVSASALMALGGAFFVQGQPEVDIERFRVRGPFSLDPALRKGGLVMVDGSLDAPVVDWPRSFVDRLSQVRLLPSPSIDSVGCSP